MTRETKIGLIIAGSFLCLVGIVVVSKLQRGDAPFQDAEEQTVIPSSAEITKKAIETAQIDNRHKLLQVQSDKDGAKKAAPKGPANVSQGTPGKSEQDQKQAIANLQHQTQIEKSQVGEVQRTPIPMANQVNSGPPALPSGPLFSLPAEKPIPPLPGNGTNPVNSSLPSNLGGDSFSQNRPVIEPNKGGLPDVSLPFPPKQHEPKVNVAPPTEAKHDFPLLAGGGGTVPPMGNGSSFPPIPTAPLLQKKDTTPFPPVENQPSFPPISVTPNQKKDTTPPPSPAKHDPVVKDPLSTVSKDVPGALPTFPQDGPGSNVVPPVGIPQLPVQGGTPPMPPGFPAVNVAPLAKPGFPDNATPLGAIPLSAPDKKDTLTPGILPKEPSPPAFGTTVVGPKSPDPGAPTFPPQPGPGATMELKVSAPPMPVPVIPAASSTPIAPPLNSIAIPSSETVLPGGGNFSPPPSISLSKPEPVGPFPTIPLAPRDNTQPTGGVKKSAYSHVCKPGETSFGILSQNLYTTEKYADALLQYNRDRSDALPGGRNLLSNPPLLNPGQNILVPLPEILETDYGALVRGTAPRPIPSVMPTIPASPPISVGTQPVIVNTPAPFKLGPAAPLTPSAQPANPVIPAQSNSSGPKMQTYTVQNPRGESILDIAERFLGNRDHWHMIYRYNQSYRPEYIIPQGTQLRIPVN